MLEQAVITSGAVLAIAGIILGYILLKVSGGNGYLAYVPGFILFLAGLVFEILAVTINGRVMIWNAGLGGWGISCLFAAGMTFLVTSVSHTYQIHDPN